MSTERTQLETKITFLEDTVDALNEVIIEQGRAIEKLERRIGALEDRSAGGTGEDDEARDLAEDRPPHY